MAAVPTSPVVLGLVGLGSLAGWGWLAVRVSTPTGDGCPMMSLSTAACSAGGATVLGALLVVTVGARASWLGVSAARQVRALGAVPAPMALTEAARRSATVRVRCVPSADRVAFCAGLRRPCVYISTGMVIALAGDELDAVLAHETAHAHRRDPLFGLLWRACADVMFFAPLLRWSHQDRQLRAELAADRAAVGHAGAPALAGALLRLVEPTSASSSPAATAAFGPTDSTTGARIAALTSTPPPRRPRPTRAAAVSVAGVLGVGAIATCLPTITALFTG